MARFIIKTKKGYYKDFILDLYVEEEKDAHIFTDIVDAFDVMSALNGVQQNVQIIEIKEPKEDDLIALAREYVEQAEKDAEMNPTSDWIQVVIVEPLRKPYKSTILNEARAFRKIVGGYFENLTIGKTETGAALAIHLNDEGKLIGLPFNRKIVNLDILVGTFFLTAYNMQGDNVSLSDAECEKLIKRFNSMEVYL